MYWDNLFKLIRFRSALSLANYAVLKGICLYSADEAYDSFGELECCL